MAFIGLTHLHNAESSDTKAQISTSKGTTDMRIRILLAGLVASSLVAAPAMANSASALSVAKAAQVKAATPAKKASKLQGVPVIALVGLAAVAVGAVVVVADDDDSDSN